MLIFTFSTFIITNIFALIGRFFLNNKKLDISYNILVGIFFYALLNLIFATFYKLSGIFYYSVVAIIIVFAAKNFKNITRKEYYKIFFLSFFVSTFSVNIIPGYDAGLYHFPLQNWLSDYGVSFGLINFNHRFSNVSILNFMNSPLWIKDNPIILITISLIFYLIFFLKIFELLNSKDLKKISVALITLLTMVLWSRYQQPTYGLVDFSYSVIYFIFLVNIIPEIISKKFNKNNDFIFINLIIFCLIFTFKMSGILTVTFLIFYLLKRDILNTISKSISEYKVITFSIFLFLLLWLSVNIIISGCINPFIEYTCFNLEWSNQDYIKMINQQIEEWKIKIINFTTLLSYLKIEFFLFSFFLLLINLFLLYYLKRKYNKSLFLISLILLLFLYILTVSSLQDLANFYQKIDLMNSTDKYQIFKFEIISILSVYILSFNLVAFIVLVQMKQIKFHEYNFKYFLLIILFILNIYLWMSKNPDPRLGLQYFITLGPILILLILKPFEFKKIQFKEIYTYITIFIFIFVSNNFDLRYLILPSYKDVPIVKTFKREGFGVKPDLKVDNLCWLEKNCYYYNDDLIIDKKLGKIKFVSNN